MRCEGCGASVFEGDVACAECGRELPTIARPPPPAPVEAPPSVAPEAPAEAPVAPDAARCALHTDVLSAGTCARCGRFCCAGCLPKPAGKTLCPACQRFTRVEQNPKELQRVRRELKVSFFFAALVAFGFGVALPLFLAGQRLNLTWLLVGLVVSLALGVCALAFAFVELRPAAWVAVLTEAMGAVLIFSVVEGKCLSWPLIAFPIVTVLRLFKLNELEAEARQLAA